MYNNIIYALIKTFLEDVIGLESFLDKLVYAGLGARICYSSDNIQTLLSKDGRLNGEDKEKLLDFLEGLYKKGHMSIFEQAVVIINLRERIERKYEELKQDERKLIEYFKTNKFGMNINFIDEIFSDIFYAVETLTNKRNVINFVRLTGTERFLTLTDWDIRRILSVKEYIDDVKAFDLANSMYITKLIKFTHPYGIEYDFTDVNNPKVLINLRAYLELYNKLLCDKDKAPQEPFKYFRDNTDKIAFINPEEVDIKKTSYGANVWILNKDEGLPFIQFIAEGVSRIMTHQFVRHRLASFEERSFRYTKPESDKNMEDVFVTPPFEYIEDNKVKEELTNFYKDKFMNDVEVYNNLINGFTYNIDKDTEQIVKVKKEDARYILPDGKRTTIICSMNTKGLINFLELRTSEHAQWEIREVANIIANEIDYKIKGSKVRR